MTHKVDLHSDTHHLMLVGFHLNQEKQKYFFLFLEVKLQPSHKQFNVASSNSVSYLLEQIASE